MADELEKTCENCKYEDEDMEGAHCRHCIHNAEECFEPKVIVPTEAEIRAKAIDEFAERLKKLYQAYDIDLCLQDNDHLNYTSSRIALESYIDEIAEQMKGGAV